MTGLRRLVPRSLRARLTVVAALISMVVFSITSSLILALVPGDLREGLESRVELAARRAAGPARTGNLPGTLSVPHGGLGPGYEVQVVASDGRVLASSAGLRGRGRMASFEPEGYEAVATQQVPMRPPGGRSEKPEEHLVAALRVRSPYGPVTVYAAVDLVEVQRALTLLNLLIFIVTPFAVLLVASVAWGAVGLSLRPVGRIRAQLEEISGQDLSRRVPVPGSGDEIARLASTTNATLERLERSAEAQRRFVADASHELRSPITSLRLQLEANSAYPEGADWPAANAQALAATERLSGIVDELLMLARLDAGATAERRVVDLSRLAAEQIRRLARARVPVHADLDGPARVLGSPVQLDRLLTNLLDNAVRHARARVDLSVAVRDDEVVVTVDDDGTGIAPEDRERVFERFTRLREGRRLDKGGSGLGLPLSREIAASHGGTLTIEDGPRGARFVLRLPGVH
ncbi:sensor histidine kinase [Actinomadura rugatobispora]|uniref:histidine kinase n=1 Tax=Actinomadura rugatobispora TaxID=1994 RepID=A0ABW0ZT10_9ACTN|nr:HAMP domain-containing sensor histidine kinase [Actinomadura rugatobispora]